MFNCSIIITKKLKFIKVSHFYCDIFSWLFKISSKLFDSNARWRVFYFKPRLVLTFNCCDRWKCFSHIYVCFSKTESQFPLIFHTAVNWICTFYGEPKINTCFGNSKQISSVSIITNACYNSNLQAYKISYI